jgi:hypothetical protein
MACCCLLERYPSPAYMPVSETYAGPYVGPCAPSPNRLYQISERMKYLLNEPMLVKNVFELRIKAYHPYLMLAYFPQEICIRVLTSSKGKRFVGVSGL